MKAFLSALVLVVVLAGVTGFLMWTGGAYVERQTRSPSVHPDEPESVSVLLDPAGRTESRGTAS